MHREVIMKESPFKFSNPFVTKFIMYVNAKYDSETDPFTGASLETNISRNKDENEAFVELHIMIGDDKFEKNAPYYIDMSIVAKFYWEDVFDTETIQKLLTINAPSLLIGYARPIVATMTNSGPYPSCNLPFYNFTQE